MPQPPDGSTICTAEQRKKIDEKIASNIVRKIGSGKTPTTKELSLLNQFADSAAACTADSALSPEWVGSYSKLGDIVGLHRASFPRLIRDHKGDPLLPRPRDNGDHSVSAWRRFLAAHPEIQCKSAPDGEAGAGEEDLPPGEKSESELRRERLIEQILAIRQRRLIEGKEFVSKSEAAQWASDLTTEFVKILDQIPGSLAPDIIGTPTIAETELKIRSAIEQAKLILHSHPWGAKDQPAVQPDGQLPGQAGDPLPAAAAPRRAKRRSTFQHPEADPSSQSSEGTSAGS